jgi:DNA polymerase-3 subunit gamma/tau
MKQALYRNWRPRSFKELVGQDHVTNTLQRAVKSGRISHAYLFTGPRGVGKTSAARILAHLVNDLPYEGDSTHLDIIEIDAASNRRIDEIRDLRDKVAITPTTGKYKVYIIDEVHMLTREAFNALLKTLEEPPAHIIFILATTEAHKLPETIISRTQRFEFKPLAAPQMAKHLQKIADSEKIEVEPEALKLLAQFGGGSFRDSISYLDQLSAAGGKISETDVRTMLGLPPETAIKEIVANISSGNSGAVIQNLDELKSAGVDASSAAAAISGYIRESLIKNAYQPQLVHLLRQLIDVPASQRPYDLLEIALLETSSQFIKPRQAAPAEAPAEKQSTKNQAAAIDVQILDKPARQASGDFDLSQWPKVVDSSKHKDASLYTALRLAKPEINNQNLILKFQFPLHQKKLEQSKNKILLSELVEEVTGYKVNVECRVDKSAFSGTNQQPDSALPKAPEQPDNLHSISNIFGQAEVVEA